MMKPMRHSLSDKRISGFNDTIEDSFINKHFNIKNYLQSYDDRNISLKYMIDLHFLRLLKFQLYFNSIDKIKVNFTLQGYLGLEQTAIEYSDEIEGMKGNKIDWNKLDKMLLELKDILIDKKNINYDIIENWIIYNEIHPNPNYNPWDTLVALISNGAELDIKEYIPYKKNDWIRINYSKYQHILKLEGDKNYLIYIISNETSSIPWVIYDYDTYWKNLLMGWNEK